MIKELAANKPGRRLMIGDGMSDLVTREMVDLFVGFGGVVSRDKVRENAEAFISSPSIAPVLPLAAGPGGYARVRNTPHQAVFERGIQLALSGELSLNTDTLRLAFEKAFAA
jgi:phosphoserine phosphatase